MEEFKFHDTDSRKLKRDVKSLSRSIYMREDLMTDNIGALYVVNGVVETVDKIEDIENKYENVVYEVVRIIDNVPLFFDEHYLRLKKSLSLLKIEFDITKNKMKKDIQKLIEANTQTNCNVRILIYNKVEILNCQMYICKSYYPGKS